ncbi:MAG: hypothetical protein ACXVLQ_09720 [Bacteriovorax sp.]
MPKRKEKKDIISYPEFTVLNNPQRKKKHRGPVPEDIYHDDENEDTLEETLIGMEYDLDTGENDWPEEAEEDVEERIRREEEKSEGPREPGLHS